MIQLDNAVKRYNNMILGFLYDHDIDCWLAGGSLRDYFMGIPITTDYDLFFPNQKEFDKAQKLFKENDCEVKWESENGMKVVYENRTYDLVKKFFDDPQKTIDAFDFTVSMFAVDGDKMYYGETTFIDLAKRQLMINKITYPASTLNRAFKYHKKGFSICLGETKKIIDSIRNMSTNETKQNKNDENIDGLIESSSGDELLDFFAGID
ncbi:MAG: hypothetical protein ACOCVF_00880 [bacterium]